jgi:hypothetical protein
MAIDTSTPHAKTWAELAAGDDIANDAVARARRLLDAPERRVLLERARSGGG